MGGRYVYRIEDGIYLFDTQRVGQVVAGFGTFDEFGRRLFQHVRAQQEVVEAAYAAQCPVLGTLFGSRLEERVQELLHHRGFHFERGEPVTFRDEAAEAAQVAHIGLYRIGGQPPFRLDVCSVFAGIDFPLLLCPCHPVYSCRSGTLRREWLSGRMRYWRKMVIFGAKLRTVSDFMILHAVWIMSS